jgi:hypothetical protein
VRGRVAKAHDDALERPLLAVGVHPNRHRGAGAERAEQELVGRRAGAAAAYARARRRRRSNPPM